MLRRILGKVKRTIFPPARFGRVELNRQTTLLGSGAAWTVDPTLLNEGSIVYGVGVGEDITFDLDLIKHFGCTVEAMDPTPKSIQYVRDLHPPEKFRMHPWGLAARDGELTFYPPTNPNHVSHTVVARPDTAHSAIKVPVLCLRTIMERLGHTKIDLLKIDIEGAEYDVVDDIIAQNYPITQLLIEFHHRFPQVGNDKTAQAVKKLNAAGYKIFFLADNGEEYSFMRA